MHISSPSPNFDSRGGRSVDMLIFHYTGMQTGAEALARLCDPEAKVSAHYMIEEDGRIFTLVPEAKRAWHAGISHWAGHNSLNERSIGIELVNPGHEWGYRPFPESQIAALIPLVHAILGRHPIPSRHVVGHSDVAFMRKEDPGEFFPWEKLAVEGIGLWPGHAGTGSTALRNPRQIQEDLRQYGYGITISGEIDVETEACIRAFQRHFTPQRVTGRWDHRADTVLTGLLAKC